MKLQSEAGEPNIYTPIKQAKWIEAFEMTRVKSATAIFIASIALYGCTSMPGMPNSPRTITVDGMEKSEELLGQFVTWKCSDFIYKGKTLIEFGKYSRGLTASLIGFVLFDGSNSGSTTMYQKEGLDHVWYWGPDSSYTFRISPEGKGLYYDFTGTMKGEKISPKAIYHCEKN